MNEESPFKSNYVFLFFSSIFSTIHHNPGYILSSSSETRLHKKTAAEREKWQFKCVHVLQETQRRVLLHSGRCWWQRSWWCWHCSSSLQNRTQGGEEEGVDNMNKNIKWNTWHYPCPPVKYLLSTTTLWTIALMVTHIHNV